MKKESQLKDMQRNVDYAYDKGLEHGRAEGLKQNRLTFLFTDIVVTIMLCLMSFKSEFYPQLIIIFITSLLFRQLLYYSYLYFFNKTQK